MMRRADVAIASPPLGRLHQFGSIELEDTSSICGRVGNLVVPNQEYKEDGEEYLSARCSGGSVVV
jgi:hypothetical protein